MVFSRVSAASFKLLLISRDWFGLILLVALCWSYWNSRTSGIVERSGVDYEMGFLVFSLSFFLLRLKILDIKPYSTYFFYVLSFSLIDSRCIFFDSANFSILCSVVGSI